MGPGIAPNGFSLDYCRRTSKSYAWLEMTQTSKGRVLAPLLCLDAAHCAAQTAASRLLVAGKAGQLCDGNNGRLRCGLLTKAG